MDQSKAIWLTHDQPWFTITNYSLFNQQNCKHHWLRAPSITYDQAIIMVIYSWSIGNLIMNITTCAAAGRQLTLPVYPSSAWDKWWPIINQNGNRGWCVMMVTDVNDSTWWRMMLSNGHKSGEHYKTDFSILQYKQYTLLRCLASLLARSEVIDWYWWLLSLLPWLHGCHWLSNSDRSLY